MAGKIIADTIQAAGDRITFNVGEVTVMTANSAGLTYIPTANINLNIASPGVITTGNLSVTNSLTSNITPANNNINLGSSSVGFNLGYFNGIKFPASQQASSDANTLDDYEEGTWTPVWTGASSGTVSGGAVYGRYVKVGNLVTVWGAFINPSASTLSGDWKISLPFTVSGLPSYISGNVAYARYVPAITGCSQLTVWTSNGYTYCHVARNSSTTGETTNQSGNVTADTLLGFTITYTA